MNATSQNNDNYKQPFKTTGKPAFMNNFDFFFHLRSISKGESFTCLHPRSDRWKSFGEMRPDKSLLYIKTKKKKKNLKQTAGMTALVEHAHLRCNLFPSSMLLMQNWMSESALHSFLCELVSKSLGGFLILPHPNRTRFCQITIV